MLRLYFPNGSLLISYRVALTPVPTLSCIESEDEVRRLLLVALNDKATLCALRNFWAQWNSEGKRVNVIDDRKLIERVARMTVNGLLAAFVVYDRHATHPNDVMQKLTAQREAPTQQSNAPGTGGSANLGGAPRPAGAAAPAQLADAHVGVGTTAALAVFMLNAEQRLDQMLKRAPNYMPQVMRATFVKVYERDMRLITIAVMTTWSKYRDLGIGGILDAILLDNRRMDVGASVVAGARKLHQCMQIAVDAREEKDLEVAARLLAEVLEELTLPAFRSAIRHGAERIVASDMKSKAAPRPPPQTQQRRPDRYVARPAEAQPQDAVGAPPPGACMSDASRLGVPFVSG